MDLDKGFDPAVLLKTAITQPLLGQIQDDPDEKRRIIIDTNLDYAGGREAARDRIQVLIRTAIATVGNPSVTQSFRQSRGAATHPYIFAELQGKVIQEVVRLDRLQSEPAALAIYRIWQDAEVHALINRSVSTVKADAAQVSFSAVGKGIVWAVVDSGIDALHPHFTQRKNLDLKAPVAHRDFTVPPGSLEAPCVDAFGHGTHVAGIVAGVMGAKYGQAPLAVTKSRDEQGAIQYAASPLEAISGMAPECKLVSYKVLDDRGSGLVSYIIDALETIQKLNDYGRRILVHGVNMSVGYDFDPEWFACGQSPLCVEVDRLVRSGVVVVVAAGNTGYGYNQTASRGSVASGMPLTINDPGNAELAITVGSTHRDMPHIYGVSYFSSKGPTGDGRKKPDLVAPGERILSCATGRTKADAVRKAGPGAQDFQYMEDSGTSMAAPHVSGVIAAFLSIRGEFVGQPEKVKEIFLSTATDLNRDRSFQGRGLVDLMRAIQSV
ncbi:MAG: S8 family peptidase [Bryobacteraceae bacterium]